MPFDLVNGWRVVDRDWMTVGDCRFDIIRYPAFGSTDPRWEVSAEECGGVVRSNWSAGVTIQGPRGLPYKQ